MRKENIRWTDCAINEESNRVKEERNIPHTIKPQKANWIGHISHNNCFLKHIKEQRFSTAGGPWHQLYRALRDSPGIDN